MPNSVGSCILSMTLLPTTSQVDSAYEFVSAKPVSGGWNVNKSQQRCFSGALQKTGLSRPAYSVTKNSTAEPEFRYLIVFFS